MAYAVRLNVFEGPLDLLLHLIQKEQIDIYDIPIASITDQYIAYLKAMRDVDLEVASEFVALAATLLSIKTRTLLPRKRGETPEEAADPREELVNALVEYRAFRDAARHLSVLEDSMYGRWPRPDDACDSTRDEVIDVPLKSNLWDLIIAMQQVLSQHRPSVPVEIRLDRYTLRSAFTKILRALRGRSEVRFSDLLDDGVRRGELVVLFLALLELGRQGRLRIIQQLPFSEILVEPTKGGRSGASAG